MDPAIEYLFRWGHFLAGITWIGLLYYFNFVQGSYFKEAEGGARVDAFVKLVPRALWWFRWGAMFTFLTGLALLGFLGKFLTLDITLGALMGTLMFLNVWLIIWPNQKILIASNTQVQGGGEADPAAAGAAPKAALASRTNTLLSFPMLYFMGSSFHLGGHGMVSEADSTVLAIGCALILAVELNGIFGKQGPMTTVRGVIVSGFVLTLVFWGVTNYL